MGTHHFPLFMQYLYRHRDFLTGMNIVALLWSIVTLIKVIIKLYRAPPDRWEPPPRRPV